MKLKTKELAVMVLLILAALGVTLYQFVYKPQQNTMMQLKTEYEQNSEKLKQLKAEQEKLPQYVHKIGELDFKINVLDRKLASSKDVPGMLFNLYELISQNSLKSGKVTFGSVVAGAQYDYFNVDFSITGKNTDIQNFLNQIENFLNEISIEVISFQPLANSEFSINLNLKVYLAKAGTTDKTDIDYDFVDNKFGGTKNWADLFKAK